MEYLSFDASTLQLTLKKKAIPKPEPNEVRVRVAYSGICGTDLHVLAGTFPCKKDGPLTPGHEFCGTVDEIGSAVTTVKVGQKVTVDPNSGCTKCDFCHHGKYHFCDKGGVCNTIGIFRDGGWATHVLVPETQIYLVPDGVEMDKAALSEPLSCLAHGWDQVNPVNVGQKVLIMGAGIIGLLWSCLFHLHGLRKTVTISEPQESRRRIASNSNLNYEVTDPAQLKGKTFDLAVDCSGSGAAMQSGINSLGKGGRLCVFGVANPKEKFSVEPFQVYMKELTILGVNINPYTFLKGLHLLEAMADEYLDFQKLGIKVFPLSQYREALQQLKEGRISKAILKL